MNKLENFKLFFKEKNEPERSGSGSSSIKSNPSDKYLSNFGISKWGNIPDELKKLNQWVTWKAEERDGNETKVPYQPNGKRAKVSDSRTWSSFDDVRKSDKIGFVFTDTDPYVFIDIDGNKETGSLSPSASFWISQFNSYTEFSPSKTGFHIIIKGKKKDKRCRCKRSDFEIYENNRFATFTGDIYQNFTAIESRQDELDRLQRVLFHDDFQNRIDKIENEQEPSISVDNLDVLKLAKKDRKFRELWAGDISSYPSRSEADLALCGKLAFYTNKNSDQIEQLFCQSGLARDKWINRQDYRKQTIDKALVGIQEFYDHSLLKDELSEDPDEQDNDDNSNEKYEYPKPIPLTEIMQKKFNPRRDVIKDLIPSGLTLAMSAEKIGKSSMFRQVGYSVATGEKCFGGTFSPAVSGHVLYLSFEDDDQSIQESMEMFCQNSAPPNYQFQYQWPRIGNGCIRALESYINDFPNTKLIIVDTIVYVRKSHKRHKSNGGYEEDVEEYNLLKKFCSEHSLSIMVSTHTKKGKEDDWARNVHGGVGQTATADTIIFIDRKRGEPQGRFNITGKRIKEKSLMAKFEFRSWELQECCKHFDLTTTMQEYWDVFVEIGNEPMTPKDFLEKLYPELDEDERYKKYDSVRQQLFRMGRSRKLQKVERSYYKMFSKDFESYKKVRDFESQNFDLKAM